MEGDRPLLSGSEFCLSALNWAVWEITSRKRIAAIEIRDRFHGAEASPFASDRPNEIAAVARPQPHITLFLPQRGHRIDPRRPRGRDKTRKHGDHQHHQHRDNEGGRIAGGKPYEGRAD